MNQELIDKVLKLFKETYDEKIYHNKSLKETEKYILEYFKTTLELTRILKEDQCDLYYDHLDLQRMKNK